MKRKILLIILCIILALFVWWIVAHRSFYARNWCTKMFMDVENAETLSDNQIKTMYQKCYWKVFWQPHPVNFKGKIQGLLYSLNHKEVYN